MRVLDTERNLHQSSWFAIDDIDARAAQAFNRHEDFFNSSSHQLLCEKVEAAIRKHAKSWTAIYHTARASQARGPNTEVKFNRVEFARGNLARAAAEIEALGIDGNDIVYKPRSTSLSVHVR